MLKTKSKSPKVLFLTLNGKRYKILGLKRISLYHFLIFGGYELNLIAVEYNGKIVSQNKWKYIYLTNNINLEIVTIVGGG